MDQRYEMIDYGGTNYKFGTGWTSHVTPHLHREFEVGIALSQTNVFSSRDETWDMEPGQIWLLNPFENHETHAKIEGSRCEYVELQVAPAFFRAYYPHIDKIRFTEHHLTQEMIGEEHMKKIRRALLLSAIAAYEKEDYYQLACAEGVNEIFLLLLKYTPYEIMDRAQEEAAAQRNLRVQRINHIIEERYDTKLLLNDIAQEEGLTLYYLSHFFKKNWGMSFQEYLLHFRCGKARELLLSTQMPITDISYVCGFSDPKYMRQGFSRLYGETPAEVRKKKDPVSEAPKNESRSIDEYAFTRQEAVFRLKKALNELT